MIEYKCALLDKTGWIQDRAHSEARREAEAGHLLDAPTSISNMGPWNSGHFEKMNISKRELNRDSRRGIERTQAQHLARAATDASERSDPHAWDVVG